MPTDRRRVHVVPQTHYDAEVFLTREETFEMGFRNIELALRLLESNPSYTFALDQVCYVRPYLERYPEKREQFMRLVRGGRLTLEGGMHAMPDMNIPCGESFIRQVLYGREFFEGELGVDAKCAWTLDSFGYHPQCPQLLAKCGYEWNLFQRGAVMGTPSDFLWEGIDGTRFPMTRMISGYAVLWGAPSNIHEFRKFADARIGFVAKECALPDILALTGADITPPEAHLPEMMEAYNRMQDRYELVFSTPERYFAAVRARGGLPVVRGDFNGVFHGCYSARISVKKRNRELETALLDWEKADAARLLAAPPGTPPGPRDGSLKEAWERVLFNQFHDIICGSHVDAVYRATMDRFDFAAELASARTEENLNAVVSRIDTSGDGIPVVVFNTLGHARSDPVEVAFAFPGGDAYEIEVRDSAGSPLPCDLLSAERAGDGSILRGRAFFVARGVPSFGYEVYRILPLSRGSEPGGAAGDSGVRTSVPLNLRRDLDAGFIENAAVRVSFDLWKGVITSLVDTRQDWEIIPPHARIGNTVVKEQDFGNFWQYNGPCKGDLFHPPMEDGVSRGLYPLPGLNDAGASFSHRFDGDGNIWNGRSFAQFSIDHPWGTGHFATRVRLYAGLPRVEIETALVNGDERVRYRAAVPTAIKAGTITHEIPFGAVARPEGEFPAQTWIDYGEGSGPAARGVAMLNAGLPGNNVAGGVMMLSLLKCTALKEGYGEGGGFKLGVATEQGYEKGVRHLFRYALVPHRGDWREAKVWQEGHGFNTPLIPVKSAPHGGELPAKLSWIAVSPPNVVLSAVRRGSRGIVARLYEAAGTPVREARIDLAFDAREVLETDLVERRPRAAGPAKGGSISFSLGSFEIKTFEIVG